MRALVVFESMFGSTETIARTIADAMAETIEAEAVNVDLAPHELAGIDLLVVGGPTHVHGMTRPATRRSADEQAKGATRSGRGIREWLGELAAAPPALQVAVFDTRLDKARWVTGSAAASAAKLLRRRHFNLVAEPESFFVTSATPPELVAGEQTRAAAWGATLVTALAGVA